MKQTTHFGLKETNNMMYYETPFDLAAFLNVDIENVNLASEGPDEYFSAKKSENGEYIDFMLGDKTIVTFYDDECYSVENGIYSCTEGEMETIFQFIYTSDKTLWFKGDE